MMMIFSGTIYIIAVLFMPESVREVYKYRIFMSIYELFYLSSMPPCFYAEEPVV